MEKFAATVIAEFLQSFTAPLIYLTAMLFFAVSAIGIWHAWWLARHGPLSADRRAVLQAWARRLVIIRWSAFASMLLTATVLAFVGYNILGFSLLLTWVVLSFLLRAVTWSFKQWAKEHVE